jgi:type I restriction enzyme S subunit
MKLKPYPSYKDSGVEWLGKVPEHWSVSPFKWQIERNDGGVWGNDPEGSDDTIVLRSTEQTVDGRWRMDDPASRKLSAAEKNAALLAEGDLVVTKSSGSALHIGKTTIITPEIAAMGCCYSNFMQRIRTRTSFKAKLAWYVMNNDISRLQFDLLSNSTTGLANLNGTMIGQMLLAIPPVSEQTAIANFLDRETAKLDTLITKQEKLIELLQEKRQAIISNAVTKGLNPDAKMKDSGVEWLGEVPEHWDLPKLKFIGAFSGGGTPSRDNPAYWNGNIPWVSPKDMKTKYIIDSEESITTEGLEGSTSNMLVPGHVLMVVRSGILKHTIPVAINEVPVAINQDIKAIKLNEDRCFNKFFMYWVQGLNDLLLLTWAKQGATVESIEHAYLANSVIPQPTHKEQNEIVTHLDQETSRINLLIEKSRSSIQLAKEHRTALISAAVTGKIDLRETA